MPSDANYRPFSSARAVEVFDGERWVHGVQSAWVRDQGEWLATVTFAGRYKSISADRVRPTEGP